MLKRFRGAAIAAVVALVASAGISYAAGLWSTLPIVGGAAYCTGTVTGTGNLGGITGQGQGTIGSICGLTEPAGPATFTGTEMVPMDLLAPGSSSQGPQTSALANITQLGQGALVVNTTAGAATIPNGTAWYFVNVGNTSATFTLPSAPIQGEILHVVASTAQTTSMVIGANSGQSCVPSCPESLTTATTAGTGYGYVYNAANSTWYRVQ